MALDLARLPKYLVLEPKSTVRVEMLLHAPSCEIDVDLENPRPGRSFVLLIGHKDGPYVQRVRLAGQARIFFDPQAPGEYVLLVANPQPEPIVLRLRARNIGAVPAETRPRPTLQVSRPSSKARRKERSAKPYRRGVGRPATTRAPIRGPRRHRNDDSES